MTNKTIYISTILILSIFSKGISQTTNFEFDKMNVAFKGLENQITVKTYNNNQATNAPILTSENGKFKFIDSTSNKQIKTFKYTGEFEKTGSHKIFVKSGVDTLLIFDFRCKNIPDPEFRLDLKFKPGLMDKKAVNKAIGIGPYSNTFDFYYKFKIKSYTCQVIKEGKLIANYNCDSFRFSEEMKEIFKNLKSGDIILFSKIVLIEEKGDERTISSIHYTIK
jgi:hypothetical protein